MATWITHMRIAEHFMKKNESLDNESKTKQTDIASLLLYCYDHPGSTILVGLELWDLEN